ncbi:unnamed protein product [Chondrus crispus]|uniref:Uncharacterized protein n=1 Tax=Chondrus crispus TaxID=2769 RepID=S0F340_CHOCR|nr:unnamed protein product [Chondrus crispus]CDF77600.1 unnamed protein product [Chondrus crispus]|eukprot:XP_005718464.1 unnamed protein product [Chondrus crispus]
MPDQVVLAPQPELAGQRRGRHRGQGRDSGRGGALSEESQRRKGLNNDPGSNIGTRRSCIALLCTRTPHETDDVKVQKRASWQSAGPHGLTLTGRINADNRFIARKKATQEFNDG